MPTSIEQLRHCAKEILALAVSELFPKSQLIGGSVDEIGFYYDFYFPYSMIENFSKRELESIEDRMRLIVAEDRPIKNKEMMRENAALFLSHSGQPERSKRAEEELENIVALIEIGTFSDLCPLVDFSGTKEIRVFHLLEFKILKKGFVRIFGTSFFEKSDLKKFIKKYKEAKKADFETLGPGLGFVALVEDEKFILLPKGEELLFHLYCFWRKEFQLQEFFLTAVFEQSAAEQRHKWLFINKKIHKLASFSLEFGDIASIYTNDRQQLLQELISSLHFMEKVFKIFGFETRVLCLTAGPSLILDALQATEIKYETLNLKRKELEFRVQDCYGREKVLSLIKINQRKGLLEMSLFYSLEAWIALCIEKGVSKI